MTASYVNRGDNDLLWGELIHEQTYCSDIRNGIHRANFMKMDFLHGDAMYVALRFCNQRKYCKNIRLYLF